MLLTELENARGGTFVVLAGYKDKVTRLLSADPGLNSRFPHRVAIADYSPEEIAEISERMAGSRGFTFEVRFVFTASCLASQPASLSNRTGCARNLPRSSTTSTAMKKTPATVASRSTWSRPR